MFRPRVTLRDVARRARVHTSTASRALNPVTRELITERIARFACELALKRKARGHAGKVSCVTKSNLLRRSDGFFREVVESVVAQYRDLAYEHFQADDASRRLVCFPQSLDVLLCMNLYGDILSDIGAGLVGGLGVAPGANFGDDVAVFEPTHGSAPKYAGLNRINPMAMMLSGVMMLRHLGETYAANMLEGAIAETIREGRYVTYDMKADRSDPTAVGTSEVADAIVAKLEKARTPTTI